MERPTYPFPLAVNSSHHSNYHRFLLGVDAVVLAPFPKPYCLGKLAPELPGLTAALDLQGWRKLYHGSFPWRPGFGPRHYGPGNVPAHRPLPPEYARPARRFGAFDFVQMADPSVSALALVAGDRRVLSAYLRLADRFCSAIESAASTHERGTARDTGRFLVGQFAEPNNRWLMPFLHVHSRVLNFTSHPADPSRLACLDSAGLARAAERELRLWPRRQAEMLADLGYRSSVRGSSAPVVCVEGVTDRLLAAMEAPRIAVLRILERMVLGDRPTPGERLTSELPPAVVAAMAGELEALIASSLTFHKPIKIGLPSEGPWRTAVREHLACHCPGGLSQLDDAATRARADRYEETLVPCPALDAAHAHFPDPECLSPQPQQPCDPELMTRAGARTGAGLASSWLAGEFTRTLADVNERIVRSGTADRIVALRSVIPVIDQLCAGADPAQLHRSNALLSVELERAALLDPSRRAGVRPGRFPLASMDELFEQACAPRLSMGHEIGGRSL